ncbi:MAG TPA: hypothetical protein PK370_03510 [Candidatus Woesebacteria bacterium]|nr:hypothetical protein [Candidatus Woesebacteria bacterium]
MSEPKLIDPIKNFEMNVKIAGKKVALSQAQDVGITSESLVDLKKRADIIESNERQGIEK